MASVTIVSKGRPLVMAEHDVGRDEPEEAVVEQAIMAWEDDGGRPGDEGE